MHEHNDLIQLLDEHQYQPKTRVVFEPGAVASIGMLTEPLGRNCLLVTDKGVHAAGHVDRAVASLEAAGVRVTIFDAVHENPTTADVDACVKVASDVHIDILIGLGGGSSMDTAKGCNFVLTNGGKMQDYWGIGKATKPMLPLIAVPTTAGTGSEMQSFALIADENTHQKMACGDPKAAAVIALLDPQLTVTQPTNVTACTGIDAIAHAIESGVCNKRNKLSAALSKLAFDLTFDHLAKAIASPDDITARGKMLLGAAAAGHAIENSMLGAAHSGANPLTAHLGITHGHAVGLMLPHVIRFNAEDSQTNDHYKAITNRDAQQLAADIESLLDQINMKRSLQVDGEKDSLIASLAAEAAKQWTANFNPRPIAQDDFARIYQQILN